MYCVVAPIARYNVRGKAIPTFVLLFIFSAASVKYGCLVWQDSLPPSIFLNAQLLLLYVLKLIVPFLDRRFHRCDNNEYNINVA